MNQLEFILQDRKAEFCGFLMRGVTVFNIAVKTGKRSIYKREGLA